MYLRHVHTRVRGVVAASVVAPVVRDVHLAVGGVEKRCKTLQLFFLLLVGQVDVQKANGVICVCIGRHIFRCVAVCEGCPNKQYPVVLSSFIVVGALSYGGAVVIAPILVVRSHIVPHGGRDGSYDLCHCVPPYVLSAALYHAQNCCERILKYRCVGIGRGGCDNGDTLTAARGAVCPGPLQDQTLKIFL